MVFRPRTNNASRGNAPRFRTSGAAIDPDARSETHDVS
jgi:hypothetical protein